MNDITNISDLTPDQDGKIDASALKTYIDSVIEEKVNAAIAKMNIISEAAIEPKPAEPDPIAPMIFTTDLTNLWVDTAYKPEDVPLYDANTQGSPIYAAPVIQPAPGTSPEEEPKKSRFSFRNKVSFFVIGVVALAVSVQLLSANGIIDFQGYADLTSKIFSNVFTG